MQKTKLEDKKPELTLREEKFCAYYVAEGDTFGNATASYHHAFACGKASRAEIGRRAFALMRKEAVSRKIEELRKKITDKLEFRAEQVLRHWIEIATADPNDVTQYQHVCCRFCHGVDHQYQWKTPDEFAMAVARSITTAVGKKNENAALPTNAGGYGFNGSLDPHPDCPQCFGEGTERLYIADTRKLRGAARRLFAGVRYKREGVEILFRNQDAALENIAKFLGMFKDKLSSPPGSESPTSVPVSQVTKDPVEASKLYQKIMGGN